MSRRNLELEDQSWFPAAVKDYMTDYLRFLFYTFNLYHPVIPLLRKSLESTGADRILDLCSGSGGAVEKIWEILNTRYHQRVKFTLTDLYPRVSTYRSLAVKTGNEISGIAAPVDAADIPGELTGFRTMFSGIHHFSREDIKKILQNTIRSGEGIAIFDGGDKNPFMVLLILVFHPVAILLSTPFLKPFRFSRLVFTYVFPLVIIGAVWDGIVSIFNLYRPSSLLSVALEADSGKYHWEAGKVRNRFGLGVSFLIGLPKK